MKDEENYQSFHLDKNENKAVPICASSRFLHHEHFCIMNIFASRTFLHHEHFCIMNIFAS
jgi:hypothetical protein